MGANYIFNVAFDRNTVLNVNDLAIVGFRGIWGRFGSPHTISLQNFVDHWVENLAYSKEKLLELVPPGRDQLVFVYPKSMADCSLMFAAEGKYSVASAAIDMENLSKNLTREIYDELVVTLGPFRPRLLITGDEFNLDEEMAEMVLTSRTHERALLGIQFEHVFL